MTGRHAADPRPLSRAVRVWRAAGIVSALGLVLYLALHR